MANFQVLAGSFQAGPAEITATELHVRRLSAKTAPVPTTVPLSAVASVEIAGAGSADGANAAISGGIVGGLTLGITGAISGAMVQGSQGVTYTVRLKDRRWFQAQSDRAVLRQFQRAAAPKR
jgi:predicted lipid-binding transport protein (Tim44 family)